ncbi:16473_t:CDS:2, partial [Dentiscutata heterogama]
NHDKDDANDLFDETKYENKELEEIESFLSDCVPSDEESAEETNKIAIEEISTRKKVSVDEKPIIEEQLNKIVKDRNIRENLKKSVKELFKNNKILFTNKLEKLGRTNLIKHVIKTQEAKSIKQLLYDWP